MEMSYEEKLTIASDLLRHCYWGNTNLTAQSIVDRISDEEFARGIFSSVLYNSPLICKHLQLFSPEFIERFIKEYIKKHKPAFKRDFLNRRLEALTCIYLEDREIRGKEWIKDSQKSISNKI